MSRICYSCKLPENNFAGVHWKPGSPVEANGPQCRKLTLVPVSRGCMEEVVTKNQLLCSYCRDPNVFRIQGQYEDLPQYRSIAKRLNTVKDLDIYDIEVVADFDPWKFDGSVSVTVSFKVMNKTYIVDFLGAGPKGYAMFRYAESSEVARKHALEFIRWWVKAALTRNWE